MGKQGNIVAETIVSWQCFSLFPSVDKLANIFVRNIGLSHLVALVVADLQFCACFIRKSMFLVLETMETCGQIGEKNAAKMFLNLFGNIFEKQNRNPFCCF